MKTDAIYLHHILDAIAQIEVYTEGVDEATFFQERMRQDAVIRQLEIIGEASRQLSEAFRNQHAEIPWRPIIGMRHRIAHDYLNIDLTVVWEVVQYDLPALSVRLRRLREG